MRERSERFILPAEILKSGSGTDAGRRFSLCGMARLEDRGQSVVRERAVLLREFVQVREHRRHCNERANSLFFGLGTP